MEPLAFLLMIVIGLRTFVLMTDLVTRNKRTKFESLLADIDAGTNFLSRGAIFEFPRQRQEQEVVKYLTEDRRKNKGVYNILEWAYIITSLLALYLLISGGVYYVSYLLATFIGAILYCSVKRTQNNPPSFDGPEYPKDFQHIVEVALNWFLLAVVCGWFFQL